ncbi:MAG: flavodoxin family protein [Hyphococcus sp.]
MSRALHPGMEDGGALVEWLRRVFERRSEHKDQAGSLIRTLGVLGAARRDGNTAALASAVFQHLDDAAMIDLNNVAIDPYTYDGAHGGDDFPLLARLINNADAIVFASPVYWYSMSGPMKVFFDRLTDLTDHYKPIGKALAGKSAFLIATSNSPEPPACFEPPFADTARYFDMHWGGMLHARVQDPRHLPADIADQARAFAATIRTATGAGAQAAA